MSTETHGQRIVRESELSVIDTGYDDCTPEVAADLARRIDAAVSEAGLSHLCSELQDEVEAYVERLDKYDAALNAERAVSDDLAALVGKVHRCCASKGCNVKGVCPLAAWKEARR